MEDLVCVMNPMCYKAEPSNPIGYHIECTPLILKGLCDLSLMLCFSYFVYAFFYMYLSYTMVSLIK